MTLASLTFPTENYSNKVWRINNLYRIKTKNEGIARFKLNDLQVKVLEDIVGQKPIRHITVKTRQVGISTFWEIYYLDDCLFREGINTGIMAHKSESIKALADIVRIALQSFPGKPVEVEEQNKTRITFPNQSSILFSLEFRSLPLHNLHISEWCLCDNERVWATVGATSKWTNISGESTGNGIGNDGYLTYMGAKANRNEYRCRFIPWFDHKEYRLPLNGLPPFVPDPLEKKFGLDQEQIHYRRQMKEKLKSAFVVEYPETEEDAFAQSGISYFDNRKIATLAREALELDNESPPAKQEHLFTVWEEPQAGHTYVLGADTAEGLGADFSAFKILCLDCRAEAMAYRGHVSIDQFYRDIDKFGRAYNKALAGIERNNHGHAVLLGLRQICKYPNLYVEKEDTRIIVDISKKRPEPKYGWLTTAANKTETLDLLKLAVEGDSREDEHSFQPSYRIRDRVFLSECLTFRQEGNKLSAASGYHDDTVMAGAIAFQMYRFAKRGKSSFLDSGRLILGEDRQNLVAE